MGNRIPGGDRPRRPSDVRDFFLRRLRQSRWQSSGATGGPNTYSRDKINSCPDLIRAEPGHQGAASIEHPGSRRSERGTEEEPERPLGLKIYRSYNDIADSKMSTCSETTPTLEIRVYRRSTEGLAGSGKAISLPRGMERSLGGAASEISNGTDYRPTSRQCVSAIDTRSSRRGSSRCSMTSIGYRVTTDEFPDSETVKRKLKDFETNFISGLVEAFRCLPPLNQLAAISIATRPDRVNQSVSLLQYLESNSIPADLLSVKDSRLNREYILTIPERSYHLIRTIKLDRLTDQRLGAALSILQDLAREAAYELGRIFEYQLSLIIEPVSMRLLARHAVDCIIHVLKRRNRILDRNTVIQGVLRGRPRIPEHLPRYISIIIGSKELKWNIYEIFKRPALRKELPSPKSSMEGSSSSRFSGELDFSGAPLSWKFYTSPQCEPMVYGYRGQSVEWDFVNCHYRLSPEEETGMMEEVSWRYDDFHRMYCPYHRLIGQEVIDSYLKSRMMYSSESGFPTLSDFVRETQSGAYIRDEVKLVFRPLSPVSTVLDLQELGLDGMDIARIQTSENGQVRSSVMDTAKEVARRCEELRSRLDDMESLGSRGSPDGNGTVWDEKSNSRPRSLKDSTHIRGSNTNTFNTDGSASTSAIRGPSLAVPENNIEIITDV